MPPLAACLVILSVLVCVQVPQVSVHPDHGLYSNSQLTVWF